MKKLVAKLIKSTKKKIKINILVNCAGTANGSIFELTSQTKLKESVYIVKISVNH